MSSGAATTAMRQSPRGNAGCVRGSINQLWITKTQATATTTPTPLTSKLKAVGKGNSNGISLKPQPESLNCRYRGKQRRIPTAVT